MASMPIAHTLQWALWYVTMVYIVLFFLRLVDLCGRAIVSGQEFGYGKPAEECADVIIALLNISASITELLGPTPPYLVISEGTEIQNKITTRWFNASRRNLDAKFNGLAYMLRGSWRKAMREYYRPAGKLIAGEAPRIELFIRHQQAKNALLGNLPELRNAIISALVHAVDGNWHLIGAEEEYVNKAVAQRRTRIIRRAILIALSTAGAIATAHFMRNYPAVAITCGLFALGELLRLLDPDGPTLLDVAGRVASTLMPRNR